VIRPIYDDFLAPFQSHGVWDDLVRGYLRPNQAFLHAYVAFLSAGDMDWDRCLHDYHRQWWADPEAVRRLLTRLDGVDVDGLAQRGYDTAARLLEMRRDIPVYLFVGLTMSDSFQVMVADQPAVGMALAVCRREACRPHLSCCGRAKTRLQRVSWPQNSLQAHYPSEKHVLSDKLLEAYGWTFGATHVGFEDLPHMLAHELCHAVRAQEADTALTRAYRAEGYDQARAFAHLPLYELLVEEGLAESTGRAGSPDLPLERILLYDPDDLRWCVAHEADLWDELRGVWDRPLGRDLFRRYFTVSTENTGFPPRTGYYLGFTLVQRYLSAHPAVSLAQAVRMPADTFIS